MMLVSLDQASDHLRRDTNDDDNDLLLKIKAASAAIISYLNDNADFLDSFGEVQGSDGDPDVPEEIQQATLLLIGHFYRYRGSEEGAVSLPPAVKALLDLYGRKPTMV